MSTEEEAGLLCFGPLGTRDKNTDQFLNRRGEKLFCRYWLPENGAPPRALVFISHGFSEHLGLYHSVGNALANEGILAFGHDHAGHGRSEGKKAYIESVDDYVDDVIDHCMKVKKENEQGLPLFFIGHSMGGMVCIRVAINQPDFIKGMVLVGPLIIPGRSIGSWDFRVTPFRAFPVRCLLSCLDLFNPELIVGYVDYNNITRDEQVRKCLKEDPFKWHGGCKVRMLLAFVKCLEENLCQLAGVNVPFLLLHGVRDPLCNVVGSRLLNDVARTEDKRLVEISDGVHQLYEEIPEVRTFVLSETVDWLRKRV